MIINNDYDASSVDKRKNDRDVTACNYSYKIFKITL